MKINKNTSSTSFEQAPEYQGLAKLVDFTELTDYEYEGKVTQKFRMIFEIDEKTTKGKRHTVSSKPLLPSLHEKANLTKVITSAFGLTLVDLSDPFETDDLIGKYCNIIVEHRVDGDKTYSNIAYYGKAKSKETWDSDYIRLQDRKETVKTTPPPANEDAEFSALLKKVSKK